MSASAEKLRLGLLLDSFQVPAWIYDSLERIVNSDYAEFEIIILKEGKGIKKTGLAESHRHSDLAFYNLFTQVDKFLFLKEPDASRSRNLQEILANTPVLQIRTFQDGGYDHFEPWDVDQISHYGLDVLVFTGSGRLDREILGAAKHGVWAYHPGELKSNGYGYPGFWEVLEDRHETTASLLRLGEDLGSSEVIFRSYFSTYPISPARTRNSMLWAAASFLPREIERLHRTGRWNSSPTIANSDLAIVLETRQDKVPTNAWMFRLIPRHLLLVVRELLQRALYRDAWHLLVNLNKDQPLNFREAVIVMPPKDRFWADPHVLQKNSSYFIFIEEYLYKNKSGHIAVIEMDSQGNWGNPIRVLEKDYHLSYPFVFEHENRAYMIPESAQHRTIELYECVRFPDKWQFKMNLMENIRAVDTTLFCYRNKWWLFTAITENEAAFPQTELFLYYAPDPLTTNWNPHPMNPIVSDVKNARPAGRIFIKDQKIFRPSQKCSGKYGYSFDLNEITCLSEREYAEKKVLSVEPRWDKHIQATHTLASQGQLTVIDALVKRRKFF